MGCLCQKHIKNDNSEVKREYSWDQRKKALNLMDYTIENVENSESWKYPKSINGMQFVARNCRKSSIYLLDHINTLTIDDCYDCKFIIGPVKGSVFLRDCKDCVCVVACGQYRMRDCDNVTVFLCCPTQPIIESSHRIHFGCYQLHYAQLEEQFKLAELSMFNNNWHNIHDFTPTHGEQNWRLLPSTMSVYDYFYKPPHEIINISLNKDLSVVPMTSGVFPNPSQDLEICLIVFFHNNNEERTSKGVIKNFLAERPDCWLVSCRQLTLDPRSAEMVFGTTAYNWLAQNGPLIGLVCAGPRAIYSCQKAVNKIGQSKEAVYVSQDPRTSAIQAETFCSVAAMLLAS